MAARVLLVGRAAGPTGFARVLRALAQAFVERGLDIWVCATDSGPFGEGAWRLMPAHSPDDVMRAGDLRDICAQLRPDRIVVINNEGAALASIGLLRDSAPTAELFAYVPVEGELRWPGQLRALTSHATLVLYTQDAARWFERAAPPLSGGIPVAVAGHGVDIDLFRPLPRERRLQARRRLFADQLPAGFGQERLDEATIVLNANRNDRRKRLDVTLAEFADFARHRPDALLAFHCARRSSVYDLERLTAAVGLTGRVLFTHGSDGPPEEEDESLNEIYNACDIGLNTSSCEGWGLIAFEHAATGAPQIVTASENNVEIWGDHALLVGPQTFADCRTYAEALSRLHDPDIRADCSRRALDHVRSPACSWETVAMRWMGLFGDGVPERR